MNNLGFIWLDIFELFDDFYCDVALIVWAIKEDALSTLLELTTPITFDPFQTIGKYWRHYACLSFFIALFIFIFI